MYKYFSSFFIVFTLFSSQLAHSAIQTADRVIAVINNGVITGHELDSRLAAVKRNLTQQKIAPPSDDVLREQVLDRMITDLIQIQYAERHGIRIDDAQLEKAIARIAEQNKLSLPQFRHSLVKQNINFDQFREEIRQEILMARLREREIDSKIFVSDNDVSDWMKNASSRIQTEFELAHILIGFPENASAEQIARAQQKIIAAQQELAKGISFASVAAKYSSAPDAMKGGVLGWRPSASLPPNFAQLLNNLPKGSVTDAVRTPAGFHLFKVLNKREPKANALVTQTQARHILIRTNEFVSETEVIERLRQIRERLKNGASFAELARLYSEDASASKGGNLGWLNPGETVPEFEQAMNQLQPGQISEPVRTQFGVHLIEVLGRRQQDIGQERERQQVRMELRQRKADEQYQNWLTALRDSAHISIRLNDK
jgi:peptidyl-prolyl cis-trans isomerase SurA